MTEELTTNLMGGEDPSDEFSAPPPEDYRRPDISALPEAVSPEGVFLARVGDRLVLEVCLDDGTWLATRMGIVSQIDGVSGDFLCWDAENGRSFGGNFRTAAKRHVAMKLVAEKKLHRKRRQKRPTADVPSVVIEKGPKKRGRPRGSKNKVKA